MIAIITKYHGPSNVKGSRISANAGRGRRVMLEWNNSEDVEGNHKLAVLALCKKMGWTGRMVLGGLDEDGCQVWVFDHVGQRMMKDAATELLQCHMLHHSKCSGGCPTMEYARVIGVELNLWSISK